MSDLNVTKPHGTGIKIQIIRLRNLWAILSLRRQKQFSLLLGLIFLASLLEVVSIGLVLPFLGMLTSPEYIFNHPNAQIFIKLLESSFDIELILTPSQLILPMTIAFIGVTIIAASVRILLVYSTTKLSFSTGSDISIDMYKRTLYQEYSVHNSRNSSEVINSIITKSNTVINGVISPALNFISSSVITAAIVTMLFLIDPRVALSAFCGFGFMYAIVIFFTRKQLEKNSTIVANHSTMMVKSLQEGLGGIRDVLISGSQKHYVQMYSTSDLMLRRASANNVFIGQAPRYVMEAIGMAVIVVIAYVIASKGEGLTNAIPILGALALGAQRLLPALQQAFNSYSQLKGSHASFRDVLLLLEQKLPEYLDNSKLMPMIFNKTIQLKKAGFYYESDKDKVKPVWVLNNINITIIKGQFVGFSGETGCGKSTLLDILMGLLEPVDGELLVDGKKVDRQNVKQWQLNISHVPQDIHLSDATIEENIAFGIPKDMIDSQRVKKAAEQAQIAEVIQNMPNSYDSLVGERGIRLSGGQRQRIGIARALYGQANVLILDEATSALDVDTERKVIESIRELGSSITTLMISHRITTLRSCDQLIKM